MSAEACWESGGGLYLRSKECLFQHSLDRDGERFHGFRPLPAPGYRYPADGALLGVGNEGTVWSASVPDGSTRAWRLLFGAAGMDPSYAYHRGTGFLLRCLSHPQGVLLQPLPLLETEAGQLPRVNTASFRVQSDTAPGYREIAHGNPTSVGNEGFCWASKADSAGGMRLDFHMTWLAPGFTGRVGHGIPLRCLSE